MSREISGPFVDACATNARFATSTTVARWNATTGKWIRFFMDSSLASAVGMWPRLLSLIHWERSYVLAEGMLRHCLLSSEMLRDLSGMGQANSGCTWRADKNGSEFGD